jgi:chromate transporter
MTADGNCVSLKEIFKVFFLIGLTGFGGGMAIVSLTERVCVHDKKWLSRDEFMHGLAFGQILGPFSLNSCTFVGAYLRGGIGGVTAAVAFLTPSFFIISLLSYLYFRFNTMPRLQSALRGTNPVIIALIIVAAWGMTKSKVKRVEDWVMALTAFVLFSFFNVNALGVIALALIWSFGRYRFRREHL